jgi:ribonuclease J
MSSNDRLVYVALGGAGEIGMNMYAYGYGAPGRERWILADVGVTFPNPESSPGVDLICADPSFIRERRDALEGIFITHAHEDHVGAVGFIWHELEAPIYAREFTSQVVRDKLDRVGLGEDNINTMLAMPEQVELGPFKVGFMPVSHSIPEASGLVIDTPAGRVIHTGDLKLDPNPQLGEAFDPDAMKALAKDGILALVCDSTNVFSAEPGRSEADIVDEITALVKDASGMVVATTFASNVARVRTLAKAASASGRAVVLLGRAMNRMLGFARAADVLEDFPDTLSIEEAKAVPREHLFLLSTGSQGEYRAASAQLSRGRYHGFEMQPGDTFLFSSKTIPGNEVSIARIINNFAEMGVTVVSEDARYHVSGHANRPDLQRVHELFDPQIVVPMHGEYRHLREHAELAEAAGRRAVIAPNGRMVVLSGDAQGAEVDEVETGRFYLDGTAVIGAQDGIVRARIHMSQRGHVAVSLVIEEDGQPLDGVWVIANGLPDPEDSDIEELLETAIEREITAAKRSVFADDDSVEELVSRTVSRVCKSAIGKKPVTSVLVNRLA